MAGNPGSPQGQRSSGFLGSLKDALVAASRDDTGAPVRTARTELIHVPAVVPAASADQQAQPAPAVALTEGKTSKDQPQGLSAAEAAREARGATSLSGVDRHLEFDAPPTTRVVRAVAKESEAPARTQLVRGRQQVKRGAFHQDPVVGWLVVVGGPGLGAFRPIFEGNNTIGRSPTQRIPIDFGDDSISSEEQAYIRYDSLERSFLFVPNLAKTNVVSVNDKRPTAAVELAQMDVITMGRTQLVFVPFCGAEFDWSELAESKD